METQAPPVPTVGRIVHYREAGEMILAAIVVKVWSPECVNLYVLPDGQSYVAPFSKTSVVLDDSGSLFGCWSWPPRV